MYILGKEFLVNFGFNTGLLIEFTLRLLYFKPNKDLALQNRNCMFLDLGGFSGFNPYQGGQVN